MDVMMDVGNLPPKRNLAGKEFLLRTHLKSSRAQTKDMKATW
jgi:hypothetical protein